MLNPHGAEVLQVKMKWFKSMHLLDAELMCIYISGHLKILVCIFLFLHLFDIIFLLFANFRLLVWLTVFFGGRGRGIKSGLVYADTSAQVLFLFL